MVDEDAHGRHGHLGRAHQIRGHGGRIGVGCKADDELIDLAFSAGQGLRGLQPCEDASEGRLGEHRAVFGRHHQHLRCRCLSDIVDLLAGHVDGPRLGQPMELGEAILEQHCRGAVIIGREPAPYVGLDAIHGGPTTHELEAHQDARDEGGLVADGRVD